MATILLVDDKKDVREVVTRILREDGHEVIEVENGDVAIKMLSMRSYDMLLSDITMPKIDGIELARKVAEDHPEIPIVLITGYAADRQRAYDLGVVVHNIIIKPFTPSMLRDTINRTLAGTP